MIFRNQTEITDFPFDSTCPPETKKLSFGIKWPVVYLIEDDQSAYVGETTNISIRLQCHLKSEGKSRLKHLHIIHNRAFNKSVILDIEKFLITQISADGKYILLNANGGQLPHDYYQCEHYRKEFKHIWEMLKEQGLVRHSFKEIQNSDRFKYSPYKTLTNQQYEIVDEIIRNLKTDMTNGLQSRSIVINGGSGTGKSVLGVFLLKLLADAKSDWTIQSKDGVFKLPEEDLNYITDQLPRKLRVGYVVPTLNFRTTLIKIFKELTPKKAKNCSNQDTPLILSPNDVAKSDVIYDLLIVDEAHRLRRRKALSGGYTYKQFDNNNENLGLDKENGTELDWILKNSRYQIFFYDVGQSIKPTDVPKERFDTLSGNSDTHNYNLISQLRCKGGNDYIQYLENIFNCNKLEKLSFKDYSFRLYEDVHDMVKTIIRLDKRHGLCRNIAGYAWDWKTKEIKKARKERKGKTVKELLKEGLYDIEIDGHKYIWNLQTEDWINSPDSVNQIGCIHTIQGYDLNYAGVILGPEIDYDKKENKVTIDRSKYKDAKGKEDISDSELLTYIKNIYKTNLARGVLGTYVYACNQGLRDYLRQYMDFIPHKLKRQ